MELFKKSYVELMELYVALLEQIAEAHKANAPQATIETIKDSQREVRKELSKRRGDK